MSDTNKYPYFARTTESTALRNPAMIRVLRYYNWSKVAIISQNLDRVLPVRDMRLFHVYFVWLKPVRCMCLYKVRIGFIEYLHHILLSGFGRLEEFVEERKYHTSVSPNV